MVSSNWVTDFINSCQRWGIAPKTLKWYVQILRLMTNHYSLDLEHFTEQELFQGLDRIRGSNSLATYGAYVQFTKRALVFLDRKELAEKIEYPRRPDRVTKIKENLLTVGEVENLIHKAPTLYERLLIELLFELGASVAPNADMLKHIQRGCVNGIDFSIRENFQMAASSRNHVSSPNEAPSV